jgi:hypothetical protein
MRWKRPRRRVLLGDAVHAGADPIARLADRLIGTKLAGCSSCASRRDKLNDAHEKILNYLKREP